jgi:hypothetical protein
MNLRESAAKISGGAKELMGAWDETRNFWRDAKALEFAETYLAPIPHHAARAATVIEEIEVLLRKVRSDCA